MRKGGRRDAVGDGEERTRILGSDTAAAADDEDEDDGLIDSEVGDCELLLMYSHELVVVFSTELVS